MPYTTADACVGAVPVAATVSLLVLTTAPDPGTEEFVELGGLAGSIMVAGIGPIPGLPVGTRDFQAWRHEKLPHRVTPLRLEVGTRF